MWVADLDVKRAPRMGETQDQTTWTVLVVGIVLNHPRIVLKRFFQFSNTDAPNDALVSCMFGELILPSTNFFNDLIE